MPPPPTPHACTHAGVHTESSLRCSGAELRSQVSHISLALILFTDVSWYKHIGLWAAHICLNIQRKGRRAGKLVDSD